MMNERDINLLEKYYAEYQKSKTDLSKRDSDPNKLQQFEKQEIKYRHQVGYSCKLNKNCYFSPEGVAKSAVSDQMMENEQNKIAQLKQLLALFGCTTVEEVKWKMQKLKQGEKFIKRVKEMVEQCEGKEENELSLSKCWKFIKNVVYEKYRGKQKS